MFRSPDARRDPLSGRRGANRLALAVCVCVAGFPLAARAQKLNLDPPAAEAQKWSCREKLAAGMEAGSELEKLGARLLRASSENDDDLARRLVAALTLRRAAKSDAFAGLTPEQRREIEQAATGFDAAAHAWPGASLATRGAATTDASWAAPPVPPLYPAPLAPMLEQAGARPEAVAAAARVDVLLRDRGFDPSGELASVDSRAIALTLAQPAALLPERTRERFIEALSVALVEADDGSSQRLAMLAEICAAGPGVKSVEGISGSRVAKAYELLLRESPDLPVPATRQRIARVRVLCGLAARKAPTAESLEIVKQLRPAFTIFVSSWRPNQRIIGPVVLRLLDSQESLNDPGVMAAESPFLATAEDLDAISRISAAVVSRDDKGRSVLRPEAKHAVARLVEAARLIARAKDRDREGALAAFRTLLRHVEFATTFPGEAALRASTQTAAVEFVQKYTDLRAAYLKALGERKRDRENALTGPLELGRSIIDFRLRAAMPDAARVVAWPGFEVSDEGLAALRLGLDEQVLGAMRAYNSDSPARAKELLDAGPRAFAAALLVGDLSRALAATGCAPPSVLVELSAGSPDLSRCPGASARGVFEFISLGAEEMAALRAAGQEVRAVEARVNAAAVGVRVVPLP
ncbi:MAG: hypothetical protein ACOYN0_05940 [Phycisphaerales bacterium]